MSGLKSDCRKFSPNVFNKTKCQNCFRIKDSHSAEALESNRALRNVSKCGYLFVAPDWDFNVSVNRTKRWQRRWFVLYDDGELTYALDQFPDTIPQGTIDMNKVLDVSDAEGITGNEFAISITTPEKVHFIKGTSKEESKWWFDVLCKVSPRYISRQKHKRNATFPCGRATIPTPAVINQEYCTEDDMRLNTFSRPKFRSTSEMMQEWIPTANTDEDDVFTTTKDPYIIVSSLNNKINRDVEVHNTLNKLISLPEDIMDESEKLSINEAYEEKLPKDYLSELEESENRRRNRRYLKRENRIQRNQRSRNDGVAKMIPSKSPTKNSQNCSVDSTSPNSIQSSHTSALAAAEKLEYLESIHAKDDKPSSTQKDDIKEIETSLEPSAVKNSKQLYSKTNLRKSESLKNIPTETESDMKDHVSGLRRYHSFKGSSSPRKLKSPSGTSSLKRTKSSTAGHPRATSTPISTKSSSTSTSPDCSTNRPPSLDISSEAAKEGTFMRTGWLLRQTLTKDWSRHWFVLKDSSLTYYRDPTAEHSGIMDGILDLNQVSTIREQESDKFYAISLRMWDDKKHILAAETDEFRKMWIQALQYAANLWSSASKEDFICTEIILPEHTFHHDRLERISTPSSLFSLPYTEEISQVQEYSSYSSDDQSEYFSLVDEDEVSDLSSSPRDLPPSPPLNRNVISLVKEKSRTRIGYGSKSNSIHNSSTDTTFDDDNHKRSESPQSQDFTHKDTLQSKHVGEETTIDSTENQLAINDVERPVSPITPPVEFMNGSENVPFVKENATISNETKLEHGKKSIISDSRVDHPNTKEKLMEQCSTCLAMRSKLLSAQEEIKKLEKELKEAHANFDNLEMFSYKLTQDMKLKEETYNSQIALMISKIDDLTSKFSTAEKNYRQLKQKTAKSETKERRRSSLKNREGLSITKEYETKLCELEKKMDSIETSFKKENFDDEGSERSFSDCSSRLNESFIATSESSETSTPTDAASSEGRGFFSRLQSLMSKIDKVNALFPVKDNSEKIPVSPKILLPVKSSDELSSLDESDEWYTQSSSDTPVSLKNSDQNIADYPQNLSECQNMLSQKLNSHLEWLKHSLQVICKDKIHSSDIQRDKLNLVDSLASELNELSLNLQSSSFTEQKSLLLFEITKALEKINRTDNFENLLKLNVTKTTYKTIFQTFCIAFAEYGNNELPVTLVSDVPQLDYFCPSISKLFPETFKSSSSFSNFPDRLQSVEEQLENSLNLIGQLKLSKYEQLWNILAEVPVQDDHVKKPPEINSIFNYITSIATDIHRITEIQLCQMPKVLSKTSKLDYMGIPQCLEMFADNLKISLTNFLNEIRGKCPMVIESTISFHKLKESTRVCIIRLVAELSFLNICNSVLSLLAEYYTKINRDFHTDYFNQGKLLSAFENGASCEMQRDIFYCPQCMTLNDLLCESNEPIQWPDFVRKYNYYNFRKFDKCSTFNFEEPSVNFCANCDNSNFSNSQAKNQKDVCNNVTCVQCDSWIQKFCTSKKQHELEQRSMELKHNAELKQLEECIIKSSEIHEQELLQKQNELLAATLQLQRLKANYEEQKRMLKTFYEEKLNFECESIDESSINESYRAEIEDLKDMFKQGLIAIENSHNRITSEMQKRHSEEIAILEAEKEKALELEAQATLTALEAIKRAHAQQLSEETASIREELLNKFQREEREKFSCKYANELEKLKAEIFKITEMFSSKCLENVTLEEKVHSLRLQLKEAHNELCNLISKNREINVSFFEGVEASAVSKA